MAYRKHVRLARLEGRRLGMGGVFTAAPDIVALIWIQSRMTFYIATAHGYDPAHPMRPAELLALQGSTTPPPRRAALDGVGKRLAQVAVERALSHRNTESLQRRLSKYVARRLARRYAGRFIPLIGAPLGAIQNGGVTKDVGRLALEYYGGAVAQARRRRGPSLRWSGGVVGHQEAHHLGDLLRRDPLGVVRVRLRGAVRRRVDHARQDRVAADAVVRTRRRGSMKASTAALLVMRRPRPRRAQGRPRGDPHEGAAAALDQARHRRVGEVVPGDEVGARRANSAGSVSCTRPPAAKPPTRFTTASRSSTAAIALVAPSGSERSASTSHAIAELRLGLVTLTLDHPAQRRRSPSRAARAPRPRQRAGASRHEHGHLSGPRAGGRLHRCGGYPVRDPPYRGKPDGADHPHAREVLRA